MWWVCIFFNIDKILAIRNISIMGVINIYIYFTIWATAIRAVPHQQARQQAHIDMSENIILKNI